MKRFTCCVVLALVAALGLSAQDIAGDWQGTIKIGDQELRVILHVTKNDNGSLKATFDSIDLGAMGIPVDTITVKDSVLKYQINTIDGRFKGKVADDGKTVDGSWNQHGQSFPLTYTPAPPPKPKAKSVVKPSDIDGEWAGTLNTGGTKLRLVLKIATDEDGLGGMLYSLDQRNMGFKVTSMTRVGPVISVEIKTIPGSLEGTLNKELTSIDGKWSQGGQELPLVLNRKKAVVAQ